MASGGTPRWMRGVRGEEVLPLINDDHPVIRVQAPPGAGKTFGLRRRIVRLLHPDGGNLDPSDLVVLAFNRVIAQDLQAEISEELAGTGVDLDKLTISTIHALCSRVLNEESGRLLMPHEREMMLYDVLHRRSALRTDLDFYAAQQALHNHEAGLEDHQILWMECQQWMSEHEARSISDLPDELLSRLKMGDYTEERYRHVFVDEFQDLTPSEQELAVHLRSDAGSLLALGDPQQSIYMFRGNDRAGLDNLEHLTGSVPKDVEMLGCQRCPEQIVDAANALMAASERQIRCESDQPANVHLVVWRSLEAEAKGLAIAIEENWRRFPTSKDQKHLCMVTRRAFGYKLRDKLLDRNPELKVHLAFGESILEEWPVREAFLWFCLMASPDPATFRAWLGYRQPDAKGGVKPSERNAGAYLNLLAKGPIDEVAVRGLAAEPRTEHRGLGGVHLWDRADRFVSLHDTDDWADLSADELVNACFDAGSAVLAGHTLNETATNDLGLLRSYAESALSEIRDRIEGEPSENELRVQLADELRHRIATREPLDDGAPADVLVTTLWGAKGLTAHHTYIVGVCDEAIPGERPESYPGSDHDYLEEQRRLFFVSLTRTKRTLVFSMPKSVENGQAKQLNLRGTQRYGPGRQSLTASKFLLQIRRTLDVTSVDGEDWGGCEPIAVDD